MIVSHDTVFLDNVAQDCCHYEKNRKLKVYRREARVDFGGNARWRSMCTLLEHDGQQLPRAWRGRARRSNQLTSTADGTRNA